MLKAHISKESESYDLFVLYYERQSHQREVYHKAEKIFWRIGKYNPISFLHSIFLMQDEAVVGSPSAKYYR